MSAPAIVTMGDPAGIGPEIVAKLLAPGAERAVVVGDPGVLARAVETPGLEARVNRVAGPAEALCAPGVIDVVPITELDPPPPLGAVSAAAGSAAYAYLVAGARLVAAGEGRALVTAPLNKEALRAAGVAEPGHTEILARLAGVEHVAMMLASDELRVVLVSVHVPLAEAVSSLSVERELRTIELAAAAGHNLGLASPRVAVAGINPHAGEAGMFGSEERESIEPAIAAARARGIDATGPLPGDTVFMRARMGEFDLVVAQYHDQGLIPVKYLGLDRGVNVTLGLPFVRTSVDHGTAFDIAGSGRADERSLAAALRMADQLSPSTSKAVQ